MNNLLTRRTIAMYKSEKFGRIFWVDDDLELKSAPLNVDGTGDFNCEDYVVDWEDWDEVSIPLLLNIYRVEIINQKDYNGSLTYTDSYKRDVV